MSNRQARREQAPNSRAPRTTRPSAGPSKRPSNAGGGSDIFSRGFLLAMAGFAVVAVVVIAVVVAFAGGDDESADLASELEKATAELPLDLIKGTKIGKDEAPVKIVSYEDFQCPFCLQYTAQQESQIVAELVKSGKVQIEYRHLPILKNESVRAATASQCAADQEKFWQYHHKLFIVQAEAGQATSEKLNVGRFSDDNLKKYASELGLDTAKFNTCFDSNEHLELVTNQQREANQFGITGTPGFLVNGTPLGAGTPSGIEDWRQIVTNVENAIATATANAGTPSATAGAATTATATATKAP
mgnify:FL=1